MTSIFRNSKARQRGIAAGYRSGLEEAVADQLTLNGITVEYETDKLHYTIPSRVAKYTPDFKLPKPGGFWYLESKGIWAVQDRAKHQLLREQMPDVDIRFLFSNAKARLYKGSSTTYASYCDKHGMQWAHRVIPEAWLLECLSAKDQK